MPVITKVPSKSSYTEGLDHVTLTCNSESKPAAKYYWIYSNFTEIFYGQSLFFDNLTLAHTGEYVCVAYAEIKSVNYTANSTTTLEVGKSYFFNSLLDSVTFALVPRRHAEI